MSTEAHSQTMEFQAEVSQLLKLMIHSLYSNQEIFLRELISNGSDACDKLRFEALSDSGLYEDDGELRLRVSADREARTISVSDNGIGMSRDEVIANIGTIAKSGTKQFLESLTGDQQQDAALIGQFGVGFYSAFVVADKVVLTTRRAGDPPDAGTRWESDGSGGYTIGELEVAERGTEVVLHLREDCDEFLDDWRLKGIIKKYSDHITFPVQMLETPPTPAAEEGEEPEQPQPEWQTANSASAMWTRSKRDIEDDEYRAFYKQVCHDFEDPLAWSHNRVEGKYEYTSLLYLPARAPFDLYDRDHMHGIKLYVQRVFIMDDAEKLIPRYLRFVRGLVDSGDLPLNVSREILQSNKVIEAIRGSNVKRVLGMLEDMAEKEADKYADFWSEFGQVMKEGPAEDFANREQILKLCRFHSTADEGAERPGASLDAYIERMQEGQEKIYYITADSLAAAKNSPHLEVFRDKGIEVLLMGDRVDEWVMSQLSEYAGKPFGSVAKGELDLSGDDEEKKKAREEIAEAAKPLLERIRAALGEQVDEVRVSDRLTSSPACLVAGEHDMALHMQQLMKQVGHAVPSAKPALEVNAEHSLLKRMDGEVDEDRFKEWSQLLFDQAVLAEGGQLEDSAGFVRRLNSLLIALAE